MKVFTNKRQGGYSGGLVIVAANSAFEAHGVMCASEDGSWLQECYKANSWEELPEVTYHGEEPKLLAENGYTE